jgi:hypothetical protein
MKSGSNLKNTTLAFFLLLAGSTVSFAQCDRTATFTASTTNYLDDKGAVERTRDEESVVTFGKKEVSITTGGGHELSGAVKTYACNWDKPFKTGKTVITTVITDGGHDMHATITIEGKEGKVTLTFEAAEMPGKKIQLQADKFE